MTEQQRKPDAARTALLVMDFQSGLVDRVADSAFLLDRVDCAITTVRERGGQVGWVRVAFEDSDFAAIPPTSVMARMATPDRRAELRADAPQTQIHPRLRPMPRDIAVRKTRVGSFTTTDLDRRLRDRGVNSLILAGISTSGVVLSTVREAMDRDYEVTVLADACADPDPAAHTLLLESIFRRHANVVTVDELSERWP